MKLHIAVTESFNERTPPREVCEKDRTGIYIEEIPHFILHTDEATLNLLALGVLFREGFESSSCRSEWWVED